MFKRMQFKDPIFYIHITVDSHLAVLDTFIDVLSALCLSFNYCLHVEHIVSRVETDTAFVKCSYFRMHNRFCKSRNTLFRRQPKTKGEVVYFDRLVLKGVFVHKKYACLQCYDTYEGIYVHLRGLFTHILTV